MGLYPAGRNQIAFFFESGTWGSASGNAIWPGQVQSFDAKLIPNNTPQRYLGTDTRNVDRFQQLARHVDFSIEFYPQDWRMLGFALGSIRTHTTGSPTPPVSHNLNEASITSLNGFTSGVYTPWISFTLEELKQFNPTGLNINRQIQGCVIDTIEYSASEGDFISCSVNGMAKNIVFTSGTGAALSEVTSPRPFIWKDAGWYIPSGTNSRIDGIKNWTWRISNNLVRKNYDGTGNTTADAIIPLERDHSIEITGDMMSQHYKTFYDNYTSGTEFNMYFRAVQNTGSNYLDAWMSGCVITDFTEPSPKEGINEFTVVITPKTVNAVAADTIDLYTPW